MMRPKKSRPGPDGTGRRAGPDRGEPVEWDTPPDWTVSDDWIPAAETQPKVLVEPLPARLIVALLVVAVLTTAAAASSWRYRARTIATTRTVTATGFGVDAGGCPVGGMCDISPEPPLSLSDAVDAVFPSATQLGASSTVMDSSQVVYASSISFTTSAGLLVSVTAQCVPSDVGLTARRAVIGSDVAIVVAGLPGCSVSVAAHAPPGVPLPVAALDRLAQDPRVQLGG